MLVIILMLTLSLNVFHRLNACGLYNACMSYVKSIVTIWYQSPGDGPVEWSLDRGCEEILCLED